MTLSIVRDDERNYELMRSRFKGAYTPLSPSLSVD